MLADSRFLLRFGILVASLLIVSASTLSVPTAMAAPIITTTTNPASGPASTLTDPNCVQPPTTIDHATFTDAQLKLYGLPHRAKGESLVHWQSMVRAAKHRVCNGTMTNISTVANTPVRRPYTIDEASSYWAGYIAINFGYSEAFGQWNVPCTTLLLHNGTALEWAGLGGDGNDGNGNGALVQSGTVVQEYSDFPGHWTLQYFAWIEDAPWNPDVIEKFTVNCTDTMYAVDWQDYSNGKPTAANMYIEDVSSGQYAQSTNTHAFSNGSTAEWILERGVSSGWPTPNDLADFHYVNFTDCYAYRNGNGSSPINLSYNYSVMWWNVKDMVSLGSLSADGSDEGAHFQVRWLASS